MPIRSLTVLVTLSVLRVSSGATFSLTPTADAFVSAANPTSNYGGAGSIGVSAAGLSRDEFQSVMQFDTTAAKANFDSIFGTAGWSVTGITLQVTATSPNNGIFNNSAAGQLSFSWMQNDSWTEGSGTPGAPGATGITFATLPSFLNAADQALGTFSYSGATSGTSSYSLNLASGLSNDILTGNLASMRAFAGDSTVSGLFNSRSFGTASARPLLIITAVATPEPEAICLLVLALCHLVGKRRQTRIPSTLQGRRL